MNKMEYEQLLSLFRNPGWQTYMLYKASVLDKLHRELEYEDTNVKKIQGRIEEIRNDLALEKKVLALVSQS